MATYDTAQSLISDAAVECGLEAVSDVYASADPAIIQLRGLLRNGGRALAMEYDWPQLVREYTITTSGATQYQLPDDFGRVSPATSWNQSIEMGMQPATGKTWQRLKASRASQVHTTLFRRFGGFVELWPQPPASGETVAFEYISTHWVALADTVEPAKDAPDANDDVILYPPTMIVAMLVAGLRERRQLPGAHVSEARFRELRRVALATAAQDHPDVYLGQSITGVRLLDRDNLPATGYGAP